MNPIHYFLLGLVTTGTSILAYLVGLKHGVKIANNAFDKAIRASIDTLKGAKNE